MDLASTNPDDIRKRLALDAEHSAAVAAIASGPTLGLGPKAIFDR